MKDVNEFKIHHVLSEASILYTAALLTLVHVPSGAHNIIAILTSPRLRHQCSGAAILHVYQHLSVASVCMLCHHLLPGCSAGLVRQPSRCLIKLSPSQQHRRPTRSFFTGIMSHSLLCPSPNPGGQPLGPPVLHHHRKGHSRTPAPSL